MSISPHAMRQSLFGLTVTASALTLLAVVLTLRPGYNLHYLTNACGNVRAGRCGACAAAGHADASCVLLRAPLAHGALHRALLCR